MSIEPSLLPLSVEFALSHLVPPHPNFSPTNVLDLLDPIKEADIQSVIHAVKILSCPDPVVSGIANAELNETVTYSSRSAVTPALKSNYLSSLPDDRLKEIRYRTRSTWTKARLSCSKLGVQIRFNDIGLPTISTPDTEPVTAKNASRFLHFNSQNKFADTLLSLPDQGKVARALNQDTFANGSTWQFNGLNLRFKDWRFIHRARQNCLPLSINSSPNAASVLPPQQNRRSNR